MISFVGESVTRSVTGLLVGALIDGVVVVDEIIVGVSDGSRTGAVVGEGATTTEATEGDTVRDPSPSSGSLLEPPVTSAATTSATTTSTQQQQQQSKEAPKMCRRRLALFLFSSLSIG